MFPVLFFAFWGYRSSHYLLYQLRTVSAFEGFPWVQINLYFFLSTVQAWKTVTTCSVFFSVLGLDPRGTLSHVLPFVCKYFRNICQTKDCLWKDALSKMVLGEPEIWRAGLESLIDESSDVRSGEPTMVHSNCDVEKLIDLAASVLMDRRANTHESTLQEAAPSQQLLRYLVSNFLCFTGPVFFMPGQGMFWIFEPVVHFISLSPLIIILFSSLWRNLLRSPIRVRVRFAPLWAKIPPAHWRSYGRRTTAVQGRRTNSS